MGTLRQIMIDLEKGIEKKDRKIESLEESNKMLLLQIENYKKEATGKDNEILHITSKQYGIRLREARLDELEQKVQDQLVVIADANKRLDETTKIAESNENLAQNLQLSLAAKTTECVENKSKWDKVAKIAQHNFSVSETLKKRLTDKTKDFVELEKKCNELEGKHNAEKSKLQNQLKKASSTVTLQSAQLTKSQQDYESVVAINQSLNEYTTQITELQIQMRYSRQKDQAVENQLEEFRIAVNRDMQEMYDIDLEREPVVVKNRLDQLEQTIYDGFLKIQEELRAEPYATVEVDSESDEEYNHGSASGMSSDDDMHSEYQSSSDEHEEQMESQD